MTGIFGGSDIKVPEQPEEIPIPDKTSSEVQALADEQRKRFYGSSAGRASTMLTGGAGASTANASKAVRMLGISGGY